MHLYERETKIVDFYSTTQYAQECLLLVQSSLWTSLGWRQLLQMVLPFSHSNDTLNEFSTVVPLLKTKGHALPMIKIR